MDIFLISVELKLVTGLLLSGSVVNEKQKTAAHATTSYSFTKL